MLKLKPNDETVWGIANLKPNSLRDLQTVKHQFCTNKYFVLTFVRFFDKEFSNQKSQIL